MLVRLPFLGCKAKVVAGFKTGAPLRDLRGFVIFFPHYIYSWSSKGVRGEDVTPAGMENFIFDFFFK